MVANSAGTEGLRQRTNGSATTVVISDEGKKMDQRLDKHETYVFFGQV